MTTGFEDRLRAAFADELQAVTPEALRRATLPSPKEKPRRRVALAGAVVVAVLVICGVGVLVARSIPGSPDGSASAVVVTDSQISVQNAIIPIPYGLAPAVVPEPGEGFYHYCLLPTGAKLSDNVECVNAGGIDIRVAMVDASGRASGIPGLLPPLCPGYHVGTSPTVTNGTIGSLKALVMTIACGQSSEPASLFWTLADHTLIIQSPFDGALQSVTRQMVAEIDLDAWPHRSLADTAEPAMTAADRTSTMPGR